MQRLLCRLGLHARVVDQEWHPNVDASVVTFWRGSISCWRCHRVLDRWEHHYDPVTGEPIEAGTP